MVLWNLLLLLPLAGGVFGDVKNPHEGCRNSNELYLDTILKVRTQTGFISLWNVNDVIELGAFDRKGIMNIIVSNGTRIEQKYVNERILKVSVDNRYKFATQTMWNSVEIQYQVQQKCSEDGVHYMHFDVTNSLRNSSNELVLKYRQICAQTTQKERNQVETLQDASLRTQWIQDGHCPGPLNAAKLDDSFAMMYKLFYDRGTRVRDIPADSEGYIVFITQGHGKYTFNVTTGNAEHLLIESHTKRLDIDGLSFGVAKYYSKKPGNTTVDLYFNGTRKFQVSLHVVPGFTEFWNTTSFSQTDLVGEPSLFTVWHFDPIKNVGVQFDGPDGNNVFKIQKEFKDHDQIVLVVTRRKSDSYVKLEIWPEKETDIHFLAWPINLKYRAAKIPYRDLVSIGHMDGQQAIGVEMISKLEDGTLTKTDYKLEISSPLSILNI